jgi:two-component system chemotaxis sensor kinase CheA
MDSHGPILIVDDDPSILAAVGELFELTGHAVVTATDGAEALSRLRAGLVPCLILLDIEMPGRDGVSFRRAQLEDPALAPIPVILHSNRPDGAQIAAHLQAVAHVPKTANFEALLPLVAAHCYRGNR